MVTRLEAGDKSSAGERKGGGGGARGTAVKPRGAVEEPQRHLHRPRFGLSSGTSISPHNTSPPGSYACHMEEGTGHVDGPDV
ncbi:unnamed protein product [Lota lota]